MDVTEWMDHSRFLRLVEGQRTLYSNALYFAGLRRMAFLCEALGRDADALATYRAGIAAATAAGDTHARAELQSALLEADGLGFDD